MCQKMKSKMGPRPISRLCWPGPARRICRYTIPGRGGISTARSKKPMFVTVTKFLERIRMWQALQRARPLLHSAFETMPSDWHRSNTPGPPSMRAGKLRAVAIRGPSQSPRSVTETHKKMSRKSQEIPWKFQDFIWKIIKKMLKNVKIVTFT